MWLQRCWQQAQFSPGSEVLSGGWQGRTMHARQFGSALALSMTLHCPLSSAPQLCLALASTPEALDDGLFQRESRLWLVRRYALPTLEIEFEQLWKQQLQLAALLEQPSPQPASSAGTENYI